MKFILFYGNVEALNHFTDEISGQLINMGHETFIIDLRGDYVNNFVNVLNRGIDLAMCYDCIGTFAKEFYDELNIVVVNILVDHPMNLAYCMKNPPEKYIQLSPDENHIIFAKRFYGIENVFFLPHMASVLRETQEIPLEKKEIPLFFSGSFGACNEIYQEIKEQWSSAETQHIATNVLEFLIMNPSATVEKALECCLTDGGLSLSDDMIATFLKYSKPIDIFIRMYYRERVITRIVQAGIPITIKGSGWEHLRIEEKRNVTILPGGNFAEVFPYMETAKITLNIMPWFKAGTHERIFNALMHYSCPLTDESSWLLEHFESNVDCAYYSLDRLEKLPDTVYGLLNNQELQKKIIFNGHEKVINNYTSKQVVETVLMYVNKCYGKC